MRRDWWQEASSCIATLGHVTIYNGVRALREEGNIGNSEAPSKLLGINVRVQSEESSKIAEKVPRSFRVRGNKSPILRRLGRPIHLNPMT
jgi:hypothetical protein